MTDVPNATQAASTDAPAPELWAWTQALEVFKAEAEPIALEAVAIGRLQDTIARLMGAAVAMHASETQAFAAIARVLADRWDPEMIREITQNNWIPPGYLGTAINLAIQAVGDDTPPLAEATTADIEIVAVGTVLGVGEIAAAAAATPPIMTPPLGGPPPPRASSHQARSPSPVHQRPKQTRLRPLPRARGPSAVSAKGRSRTACCQFLREKLRSARAARELPQTNAHRLLPLAEPTTQRDGGMPVPGRST